MNISCQHALTAQQQRGCFGTTRPRANCSIKRASLNAAGRARSIVKAYLEPTTTIAVTQQAVAFALAVGAEGVYTRGQLPETAPGRPEVVPVAVGVVGTVAAVALVASNADGVDTAGLCVGLITSTILFAYNVKRTIDTKHDPSQWPGPKSWPGVMALVSFFALNVFLQGLRPVLHYCKNCNTGFFSRLRATLLTPSCGCCCLNR